MLTEDTTDSVLSELLIFAGKFTCLTRNNSNLTFIPLAREFKLANLNTLCRIQQYPGRKSHQDPLGSLWLPW